MTANSDSVGLQRRGPVAASGGSGSEQGQVPAAAGSVGVGVGEGLHGVEQAPGHGTNLVKSTQGLLRANSIDGTSG